MSSVPHVPEAVGAGRTTPRLRRVQRTALVLLLVTGCVNYVDRVTLGVGLPLIRRDLGLSLRDSGYLLSAFLWAYAFCQLPAGALVDRLGARRILSGSMALWSAAQGLAGLVRGFWPFVGARVALGVGESPQYPTCARVVADWFPRAERGLATGIWNCSSSLGTAIAAPLVTWLMLWLGWRWAFAAMGAAGLAIATALFALHRDPAEADLTDEERAHLADVRVDAPKLTWAAWRRLLRSPTTWGMALGFFGTVYVTWTYTTWLPQYLELEWHLSIAHTGWVTSIPYVCGVVGSIAGGRICDRFLRAGRSAIASRKIPFVGGMVAAGICTLLAARASSGAVAVACISATLFLLYVASSASWALVTVATRTESAASLGAIQNFGGYVGGALAPIATGAIAQATGSFRWALVLAGAVAFASALAHFALVRRPTDG